MLQTKRRKDLNIYEIIWLRNLLFTDNIAILHKLFDYLYYNYNQAVILANRVTRSVGENYAWHFFVRDDGVDDNLSKILNEFSKLSPGFFRSHLVRMQTKLSGKKKYLFFTYICM